MYSEKYRDFIPNLKMFLIFFLQKKGNSGKTIDDILSAYEQTFDLKIDKKGDRDRRLAMQVIQRELRKYRRFNYVEKITEKEYKKRLITRYRVSPVFLEVLTELELRIENKNKTKNEINFYEINAISKEKNKND